MNKSIVQTKKKKLSFVLLFMLKALRILVNIKSSAYVIGLNMLRAAEMLFISIINSRGPSTESCGTHVFICNISDYVPSMSINSLQFER